MSDSENIKEESLSEEQSAEETKEVPLSEEQPTEVAKEAPLPEEKPVEEVKEAPKAPEPTATGDEKISILKHRIYIKFGERGEVEKAGVEFSIKNVSDKTIDSALFEVVFYDAEGNALDTIEDKTIGLPPDISRTIRIISSSPERDKIESYSVRLVKTTKPPEPTATGDETISILKHGIYIKSEEHGEEEKSGVELSIKNVSDKTIGSALFEAVFYDAEGNALDTVEDKTIGLPPNISRTIRITFPETTRDKAESYSVRLIKTIMTPEPTATGDEKILILKHGIYIKSEKHGEEEKSGVELSIKNVSDETIHSALFEAVFYDAEGNTLETVAHKTFGLPPDISRTIRITIPETTRDKAESYSVRLVKTTITPTPTITGNDKILIHKHKISITDGLEDMRDGVTLAAVEFVVMNVSDSTIARAIFAVEFYDIEGNIVDTIKHKELCLKPNTSRGVHINSSITEPYKVENCNVRLIRAVTTDAEKVQLRRHFVRTNEVGEEEVEGNVKNISEVKTDAALVATFYDRKKETIGTKVILLRDIEPNELRQFHFVFKPQEGDIIGTHVLNAVCDIEEIADSC